MPGRTFASFTFGAVLESLLLKWYIKKLWFNEFLFPDYRDSGNRQVEHRFCWRIPWHLPRAWPTKWHESCYLKSWKMENSDCQRQISFWKWFENKQRAAIDKCLLKRMTNKWTQGYLLWHVPWTEVTAYIKICIFLALWINIKQEYNCL